MKKLRKKFAAGRRKPKITVQNDQSEPAENAVLHKKGTVILMRRQARRRERPRMNASSIFLSSDRELTVSKCEKVEKYCPDEVILRLSDMRVVIRGKEMTFAVCYGSEIRLAGKIEELRIVSLSEKLT